MQKFVKASKLSKLETMHNYTVSLQSSLFSLLFVVVFFFGAYLFSDTRHYDRQSTVSLFYVLSATTVANLVKTRREMLK